jgi:two-component system nitrogen regulation sensor histidine kinase NtrY
VKRLVRSILVLALFIGVPWGLYYWLERAWEAEQAGQYDRFLLPALSLALIVLILGLAGVLIRNLVKLIIARRRGILGATLAMKLVFFYLALVLLPAIVLFTGSATVIKKTVEAILRTPLEYLTKGEEVVDAWTAYFQEQSLRRASHLASELRADSGYSLVEAEALVGLLERRQQLEGMELIQVVARERGVIAAAEGPMTATRRERLTLALVEQAQQVFANGAQVSGIFRFEDGLVAHAAVPWDLASDGSASPSPRAAIAVALAVPTQVAGNVEALDDAAQAYRQFRSYRRELIRFYVPMLVLIFIATMFVASWIGLYVARRITEPIQEMASAARAISAGDLAVRVKNRAGDEMGTLVDAFNEMAAQLHENREVITRSTADLRAINRALDERRRFIETLVANLSTAVISLDPRGRVITANPAVKRVLGLVLRAGDEARRSFARQGLEPLVEFLDTATSATDASLRQDLELPAGAPVQHVSARITPLQGRKAENLGSLLMVEDLSDVLRAQKLLAWQEVARRITHEIKNPLTPIQLAAQRLRKKFLEQSEDLDEVIVQSASSIEHEVTGLKELLDEFSRFARMPQISPRPVEFGKVVESVLSLYSGHPEIEWEVDLDPKINSVTVDAQQVRRVLINLIDNAVSAVGGKGRVWVSVRPGSRPGWLKVEIADSGPGIRPEDRDKMFVPYFSTKRKGTGLGLTIAHKIVTDHGGTIRVQENQPQGARFVIELPGAAGPVTASAAAAERGEQGEQR